MSPATAARPGGDEHRAAMTGQGRSLLRITVAEWGPVATGSFPRAVVDKF